jgi:hypothetical protein
VKINGSRSLNRRELAKCFFRFGLAVPTVVTMSWPSSAAPPRDIAANAPERTVKFRDGVVVPALGQGSARLGQGRHPEAVEEEPVRSGPLLDAEHMAAAARRPAVTPWIGGQVRSWPRQRNEGRARPLRRTYQPLALN